MKKQFIYQAAEPMRLDLFLVQELEISRSQIKKLIDNHQVLVNEKVVTKTGFSLENNFQVQILDNQTEISPEVQSKPIVTSSKVNVKLDIIYEDDYLLVINKPTNLLVYPTNHHETNTLVHGLKTYLNWNPADFNDQERMGIVHRLDKDTNGLMVIAKNQMMVEKLTQMFMFHEIDKHYHAIVYNHFNDLNKSFSVDVMLGYDRSGKYKMKVGNDVRNGKQAISIIAPLMNLNQGFSLVDVQILTGRTHQIRATMRHLNHPLLNDSVYGPRTKTTSYGQYLICYKLGFVHPITNQKLNFEIPYDQTFQDMYEKLTK